MKIILLTKEEYKNKLKDLSLLRKIKTTKKDPEPMYETCISNKPLGEIGSLKVDLMTGEYMGLSKQVATTGTRYKSVEGYIYTKGSECENNYEYIDDALRLKNTRSFNKDTEFYIIEKEDIDHIYVMGTEEDYISLKMAGANIEKDYILEEDFKNGNIYDTLRSKYKKISGPLSFYYGVMGSSKSANLLMNAKNYEIQGKKTIALKPSIDTRWSEDKITSRAVESRDAIIVDKETNVYSLLLDLILKSKDLIYCVLIDEVQFFTKEQIKQLSDFNLEYKIPISAYGLKNTYKDSELFEGSAALFFYADKIEEISTVCYVCNEKATQNLRLEDYQPVYDGSTEKIGDVKSSDTMYLPVCRKHYVKPDKEVIEKLK